VAGIVEGCTDTFEDPKPPWRPRKEAYVAGLAAKAPEVLLVVAADKLDNARAIVADLRACGSEVWSRFTGGRDGSLWYYRAVADAMLRSRIGPIVVELDAAVTEMARIAAVLRRA
jgi:(p)ppGpp synthase/HD superfamily hydrolase